jgi:hypothetical protein
MSVSKNAYRAKAEKVIQAGTDFIARGVNRGPAVDQWEALAMNILEELDKDAHAKRRTDIEGFIGRAIFGKKDRIRDLIAALEKACEPEPGEPFDGFPKRRAR